MKLSEQVRNFEVEAESLSAEISRLGRLLVSANQQRDSALARVAVLEGMPSIEKDPWRLYPPPQGEEWHNPDKLTPEQVGVKEGWRLLTVSEVESNDQTLKEHVFLWSSLHSVWRSQAKGNELCFTYRTRAPLPRTLAECEAMAKDVQKLHTPDRPKFELPHSSYGGVVFRREVMDNDRALAAEINALWDAVGELRGRGGANE